MRFLRRLLLIALVLGLIWTGLESWPLVETALYGDQVEDQVSLLGSDSLMRIVGISFTASDTGSPGADDGAPAAEDEGESRETQEPSPVPAKPSLQAEPDVSATSSKESPEAARESQEPAGSSDPVREKALEIAGEHRGTLKALELVYDWVTHNIAYDAASYYQGTIQPPDALRTLRTRMGICGDYSLLTRDLLLALDIEAEVVTGTVQMESGSGEHAWNLVRVGGVSYGIDTTWGAGYLDSQKRAFVSRPTRLYLTTPQELARLHGDYAYRRERQQDLRSEAALDSQPVVQVQMEEEVARFLDDRRLQAGVDPLKTASQLVTGAREEADRIAGLMASGQDWSLDPDTSALGNMSTAWMMRAGWGEIDAPGLIGSLWEGENTQKLLMDPEWVHVGVGVISRDQLTVVLVVVGR